MKNVLFLTTLLLAACQPSDMVNRDDYNRAMTSKVAAEKELYTCETELDALRRETKELRTQLGRAESDIEMQDSLLIPYQQFADEMCGAYVDRIPRAPATPSSRNQFEWILNEGNMQALVPLIVDANRGSALGAQPSISGFARHASFRTSVGDPDAESLRQQLRDPRILQVAYRFVKPAFVNAIVNDCGVVPALRHIDRMLPALTVPLTEEQRAASREEDLAHARSLLAPANHPCGWHYEQLARDKQEAFITMYPFDYATVKWRLRREAEGGQRLVDTWIEIIRDFETAIGEAELPPDCNY